MAGSKHKPQTSRSTASAKGGSSISLLMLAGMGGLVYTLLPSEKLTLEAKVTRDIEFVSNAVLAGTKDTYKVSKVPVPMVSASHYPTSQREVLRDALNDIKARYGYILEPVSQMTRVPIDLIACFIFIESAGKERAVSHAGAVGLMQLIPSTAVFTLALENIKGRLNSYEKHWLASILGENYLGILKMRDLGTEVRHNGVRNNAFISKEDLYQPDLNILLGSIFLGILLDEERDSNGLYRLDKVVVRYNMGYNAYGKGKRMKGTPNQLVATLPGEPAAFVKKLVGQNGLLTLV